MLTYQVTCPECNEAQTLEHIINYPTQQFFVICQKCGANIVFKVEVRLVATYFKTYLREEHYVNTDNSD